MRYSLVQLDLVLSRCRRFFFSLSLFFSPPLCVCIKSSCLIFGTRDLFLLPMCEAFFRSPLSLSYFILLISCVLQDIFLCLSYFYGATFEYKAPCFFSQWPTITLTFSVVFTVFMFGCCCLAYSNINGSQYIEVDNVQRHELVNFLQVIAFRHLPPNSARMKEGWRKPVLGVWGYIRVIIIIFPKETVIHLSARRHVVSDVRDPPSHQNH